MLISFIKAASAHTFVTLCLIASEFGYLTLSTTN